jgi:peptide/nickel transport system permease protein
VFGSGQGFGDQLVHLLLPSIALAIAATGYVARVSRAAFIGELGRDHVATARGRGLGEGRVVRHHVIRNALVPVTTSLGLTVASLIAGAVVVEDAFQLNGLGSLLIQAVNNHDFPVVQAVSLLLVASFIIVNTLVDIAYPLFDPRLRGAAK